MSFNSSWNADAEELVREFTQRDLTADSAEAFVSGLGYGRYKATRGPISVEKLILVYGKTEHVFTSQDLSWLEQASSVISGVSESEFNVYAIEMNCNIKDYYICCAALIKIFNAVYEGINFFVFKFNDAIAFGAARYFEKVHAIQSFCVSGLISASNPSQDYSLFEEFAWGDEFSSVIAKYSPQEKVDDGLYFEDRPRDPGLQSYLAQFNFGIISENVNKEYQYQYAGNGQYQRIYSYKETCILLQKIAASDNMTSLDVLENAEEAEKRATAQREKLGTDAASDVLTSTSQDSLHQVDADSLLKEILDSHISF